jgi:hypothetical protein
MATDTVLTFTDAAGKITGTRPNGGPAIYLTGDQLPEVWQQARAGLPD